MLRVSWTEHLTYQIILTKLNTTRQVLGIIMRRKLSFFGHTIRDGGCELRGEVCDSGESEWDAKAWKTYIRRHTVVTSQHGWLNAWNKYLGIALNGEGWCVVRHGRLIITPDGIGNQNSLISMSSLIRLIPHIIHCHSNAFASSAKSWITSFNSSLASQ